MHIKIRRIISELLAIFQLHKVIIQVYAASQGLTSLNPTSAISSSTAGILLSSSKIYKEVVIKEKILIKQLPTIMQHMRSVEYIISGHRATQLDRSKTILHCSEADRVRSASLPCQISKNVIFFPFQK